MSTIDRAAFERSDYNTLINNVSASIISNIYKKINYYQTGVLEPVEMHDDLQTDPKFTRIRYEGSKVVSAKYNLYTSASIFTMGGITFNWEGDASYGKTAAIDYTVEKFAFANSINVADLNFYDKTTLNIKYLIDKSGSITELSANNNNLFEVQNTYKKGDTVYISLFDRYNPTNQATLDGPKIIFEGGFRYSPIMYREANENLVFTYTTPTQTVENRFGLKAVNTTASVWQTVGDTNAEFSSNSGIGYTFTLKGVSDPNNKAMSLSKVSSVSWPYSRFSPLTDFEQGRYLDYTLNAGALYAAYRYPDTSFTPFLGLEFFSRPLVSDSPSYYAIDWMLPVDTTTLEGGYQSINGGGTINEVKAGSENYVYYQVPRDSIYTVNIDIPIKFKARNLESRFERTEEKGPSIVKIIAVLEVLKSGTSNWEYIDFDNVDGPIPYGITKLKATNVPVPLGGRNSSRTTINGVNEDRSFVWLSEDSTSGNHNGRPISPFYEVRCQLFNRELNLKQNDRLRIKLYFAEVTTFFRRCDNIYFEIPRGDSSKNYFEVYDAKTADVTLLTTKTIGQTPQLFTIDSDNRTIIFNDEASLLYKNAIFQPQDIDNPLSIANLYSPIDSIFSFQRYDIIRFTSFYAINPDYYYVLEIVEPVIGFIGTAPSVISPLRVVLNQALNPNLTQSTSFAIFRRIPDETSVIINFKKAKGLASNALLLPHNLEGTINKGIGNIIGPLKDTVLSKVLVIT